MDKRINIEAERAANPRPWRVTSPDERRGREIVDALGNTVAKLTVLDMANAKLIVASINATPPATGETELPALPEPGRFEPNGREPSAYSKQQMQQFGRDAIAHYLLKQAGQVGAEVDSDRNAALRAAPAGQHDANCPACRGTGQADSGGTYPWGEPALIRCDCDEQWIFDLVAKHELTPRDFGFVRFRASGIFAFAREIEAMVASRSRVEGGHGKPDATNFRQEGEQPTIKKGESDE